MEGRGEMEGGIEGDKDVWRDREVSIYREIGEEGREREGKRSRDEGDREVSRERKASRDGEIKERAIEGVEGGGDRSRGGRGVGERSREGDRGVER